MKSKAGIDVQYMQNKTGKWVDDETNKIKQKGINDAYTYKRKNWTKTTRKRGGKSDH